MTKQERDRIINLLKNELTPVQGYMESSSVAYCVAKATETLKQIPEKVRVFLSEPVIKRGMHVGIPGTGKTGLPLAAALGSILGKTAEKLDILKGCTPHDIAQAELMVREGKIAICPKKNNRENIYIEAVCESNTDKATVIIAESYNRFVHISRNDDVQFEVEYKKQSKIQPGSKSELTFRVIYEFTMTVPLKDSVFLTPMIDKYREIAGIASGRRYGYAVGKILKGRYEKLFMGECAFTSVLSYTSEVHDMRMMGEMFSVTGVSGNGGQGINAFLPVIRYAQKKQRTEEELLRAITLSSLVVIYINECMDHSMHICRCAWGAMGSVCALSYLLGGSYHQIIFAARNLMSTLTGMMCDGVKPACSLKMAGVLSTAFFSVMMAMEGKGVQETAGILEEDIQKSIRNFSDLFREERSEKVILDKILSF